MTRALALAAVIAALVAAAPASAATTFTVTKTDDTNDGACMPGNCSLRDAVIAANATAGADTVVVPPGHFVLTGAAGEDAAATGDLDITEGVTIQGAGAASTTIDANSIDRIFDIFGTTTQVSLSGMTLTGGVGVFGAAIQTVGAALTLDGVDVVNNASGTASTVGQGVIYDNGSGATALNITNSSFTGDSTGGNGHAGFGMVDYLAGGGVTVTVRDSTFSNNRAGGGGSASSPGFGIFEVSTSGPSSMTIDGTTFEHNFVGGQADSSSGFGLINFSASGPVSLTDTQFLNNAVGGGGTGSSGFGMVDDNGGTGTTLTLTRTTFSGNTSGGDGSTGFGGAINDAGGDTSSLTITDSEFSNNSAGGAGASGSGGAINYGGGTGSTLSVTGSSFSANSAGGDGAAGFGGAIDDGGGNNTTRSITSSSFSANTAGGGGGSGFGGAIDTGGGSSAVLNLTNTTITGNSTGGGGAAGFGGGVDWGGGTSAQATLSNVTLASNSAGGGGGSGFGGGYSGQVTTASNTIIADNISNGSPGNCESTITSGGHNIENGTTCGFTDSSDQNVEPGLAPIGDYGGPTETRALLATSPARDHGAGCPATDQRGQPRPFGPACDVGAYEFTLPGVATGKASSLTTTSAVLGGSLVPSLRPASFHFDYGRTTAYDSHTAPQTAAGSLSAAAASAPIGGLTPGTTYHFRLVATGDDTVAGADATFTTPFAKPVLSRLSLHPSSFPAAASGGSITRARKTGTNIAYTVSDATATTFKVLKPAKGRRQAGSCRKPSRRNRHGRRCTRLVSLGSFTHRDKVGRNKLHFTGRVHRHKLAPGKYRLRATPRAHGLAGKARTVRFKIIR